MKKIYQPKPRGKRRFSRRRSYKLRFILGFRLENIVLIQKKLGENQKIITQEQEMLYSENHQQSFCGLVEIFAATHIRTFADAKYEKQL